MAKKERVQVGSEEWIIDKDKFIDIAERDNIFGERVAKRWKDDTTDEELAKISKEEWVVEPGKESWSECSPEYSSIHL